MKRKWIFMLGLAAAGTHLILVALGAFGFEITKDTWMGRMVNYYGDLSGASSGYGFFAPGVTIDIRAMLEVTGADRRVHVLPFVDPRQNREVQIRAGDIIEQFGNDEVDDAMKFQRGLCASLAGAIFGSYPGALAVKIRLEKFEPPSMEDFRKGKRPEWTPLYSAQFQDRHHVVKQ